ncbi:hypothetical protein ACVIW2_007457 [Bradyrhizobium huanghuaihaiense]|uniref:Uncharacterized protein n=1 Tax=Bradyrhizobium huanghuaihaiense TaxID=990078 RepID=A0A562RX22_9BRAD|nr:MULTISPECIES: hypothetical protein [Bradyrhizobium]TWI72856.1 hypothetical protein IQ16_02435 [Bradyrhizobium huanghuaihaiense]UWU78750.1 hypothetical protein N2603_09940 [Bradyrhizobium sp. CB3035]
MITATVHPVARAPSPAAAARPSLTRYLMVRGPARDYLQYEPAARRMTVLPRMFGPEGY